MGDRPRIVLLATGGTISNPPDVDGYLPGRDLVKDIPEIGEVADVTAKDVASVGSAALSFETWWDLHEEITTVAEHSDPPDGVVITHGSNTLEETAYFLHLTLDTEIPVTLTAAQRNHGTIGNDGDRNLLDAVKIAAHSEARGRGAMVVLNDEIHSARDVTKLASTRPDAWESGNLGVLGLIDKRDNKAFFRETQQRHAPDTEFTIADRNPEDFPRVEIIYSAVEMDGSLIEAAVRDGADGIVLASLPGGVPSRSGQADAAATAHEEGTPVVLSHRGTDGWPYPREDYLWGNTLTPQKARILLALALMHTDDYDEIQRMFEEY